MPQRAQDPGDEAGRLDPIGPPHGDLYGGVPRGGSVRVPRGEGNAGARGDRNGL